MKISILTPAEVLAGFDAVSALYPYVPPLSHWRAWEHAAYQHHRLAGRILDLGCGDGRYFELIWPGARDVVGVDMDPRVAALGRHSGVYHRVHVTPATDVPEPDSSFDHVFANCSLEHMNHLDAVLAEVCRCLRPGGTLLCSVVTDHFLKWSLLPILVKYAGFHNAAATLRSQFIDYHHLVNPLSPSDWQAAFVRAGLIPLEHLPILPKNNSAVFLLMDSLWHLKSEGSGELGDVIHPLLSATASFPAGFRKIVAGLLEMETDWNIGSGAVFLVRKPN